MSKSYRICKSRIKYTLLDSELQWFSDIFGMVVERVRRISKNFLPGKRRYRIHLKEPRVEVGANGLNHFLKLARMLYGLTVAVPPAVYREIQPIQPPLFLDNEQVVSSDHASAIGTELSHNS